MSDGGVLLDREMKIERANARGYDELAAINGAPVTDRPGELVEDLLAAHPEGFRQAVTTANLPLRTLDIVARPVEGARGRRAGWVLSLRDVTPVEMMQESLATANAHLRKAQQIAHIGSFEFDFTTLQTAVSADLSNILTAGHDDYNKGFSLERALALLHPDDAARVLDATREAVEAGRPIEPLEVRLLRPDGAIRQIRLEAELERAADGQPIRLVGTAQDVTDHERYARRLEGLRRIDAAIREAHSLEVIIQTALHHLHAILPCQNAGLLMLDAAEQQASVLLLDAPSAAAWPRGELFTTEQWAGLRQGDQLVLAAATDMQPGLRQAVSAGAQVWLVVPLIDRDELIGMVAAGLANAPEPEQAVIAAEVANLLAVAIRQTQLDAMVFQQALHLEQMVIERTNQLRRAKEEVEAILNNSADTILLTDQEGRVLRANLRFEAMFQQPVEMVLGQFITTLIGQPAFEPALQAALRSETVEPLELTIRRADGSGLRVEIGLSALQPDGTGVVCSLRDVTRRFRAEQALRESERQYRLLAEHTADFVTLHDTFGQLVYASPSIERALGYTTAEIAAAPQDTFFHPDDFMVLYTAAWQVIQQQQPEARVEVRMRTRSGEFIWTESRVSLVRDERGEILHVMNLSRDITERKRLEEHLHRSHHELEQRVLERTAELQTSNAELRRSKAELEALLEERERIHAQLLHSEKMSALGRLVASIAHEINNPIQAVLGCISLMQMEWAGQKRAEKIERYLTVVQTETERIATIVCRMRDFYRPAQPGLEPVSVQAVVQTVLALTNKQLQHSRIEVVCEWDETLPAVEANPDELKQVFLNLILNAVDAMPDGGVLRVASTYGRLPDDDADERTAVALTFTDEGKGIPARVLPHIFEPFFTTKNSGSGLGLSISYGIVAAHGGKITVENDPPHGATFTVLLPVAQLEGEH